MEKIGLNPDIGQGELTNVYERSNLTRLQLLYWMGHKIRSDSPLFNTILAFTIDGSVDAGHFEKAFRTVLEHCDVLRTVIEEVNSVPQRRIIPDMAWQLNYMDFSSHDDPEETVQAWMEERAVVPLNIKVCMFDTALFRVSPDRFIWYLNQDHLITDASSALLIYELTAKFYTRSINGEPLEIPGLPSFERYAEYERTYRNSPQAERDEKYWQKKLIPGPDPLRFYGRLPRKKSTRIIRHPYDLGVERSQKVREIARRKEIFTVSEDLTVYNIFAALFFAELYRLSGNKRLGFVTTVHNRFNEVSRNTVGLLMELSPYQVEVSEDETILSLIQRVKRETRETLSYYQYGSALSLQQESFDVMFNMYKLAVPEFAKIAVQVRRIHPGHGSESLVLHVSDLGSSGSFLLNFDFHRDVFSEGEQKRTVESFVRLLDSFLEDDSREIDLVAPPIAETHDLSKAGNGVNHLAGSHRSGSGIPQDMLESQLIKIWEEILGVRPIGIYDNFFDLGGNSWLAVRLFVQIEELTGQYLPLATLLSAATISDLAKCIREEAGDNLWSTLVKIQSGDNGTPLFMVPGAGGNGLAVSRIAQHLGEDQPVYMFQIPLGKGDEEPPFTRIEDMAAHYVEALRSFQAEGPYYLGGYSAGGLVAFEVAQQLVRQGQEVAFLAIIDVAAQGSEYKYLRKTTRGFYSLFGPDPDRELESYLYLRDRLFRFNYFWRLGYRDWMQGNVSRLRGQLGRIKRSIHPSRRNNDSRVQDEVKAAAGKAYIQTADTHNGRPRGVEEGDQAWRSEDRFMQQYFEVNNIAVKCYVPERYSGHITLFRSREGYQYPEQRSPDARLGWGRVAASGLEMYVVPGNHMQIVREPSVKALGEQLRISLDRARANGRDGE